MRRALGVATYALGYAAGWLYHRAAWLALQLIEPVAFLLGLFGIVFALVGVGVVFVAALRFAGVEVEYGGLVLGPLLVVVWLALMGTIFGARREER